MNEDRIGEVQGLRLWHPKAERGQESAKETTEVMRAGGWRQRHREGLVRIWFRKNGGKVERVWVYFQSVFFFQLSYFDQTIITLQYCGGFCYQHELATGIHVNPILNTTSQPCSPSYPFELSQSTSFGCPASCIKPALIMFYIW